ncbi:hypothetical protein ACLCDV_11010 [Sphingobacterium sp. Lzh-3]|uniref:hypothetical protein n=1 Tax=Sphingobacterium sp. Lzh-3 TaxID=3382150 RepID=UPI00398D53E8
MNGDDLIERLLKCIIENRNIFEAPSKYFEEDFENYFALRIDNYYSFLKENNFSQYLNELYKFQSGITSNKDELKLLNRIYGFSDVLKRGIKNYFNGKPNKFYESFSSSLDNLLKFKDNVFITEITLGTNFYRVRNSPKPLRAVDMFHIPFQLRHLCSTQRYSIPGVPSIYLGSSTKICFRELEIDEPKSKESYISLFQTNKILNVLEILTVEGFIGKMKLADSFSQKLDLLLKFVTLFPLYLASTIKVKVNQGFKPEYIVAQFLLEYVSSLNENEKKIDGIKFPSTKVEEFSFEYNLVLPIVQNAASGHCSYLKQILRVSEPFYSGDISIIKNTKSFDEIDFKKVDLEVATGKAEILHTEP